MQVLIIALNHQIQSARLGWSSDRKAQAFMNDQKEQLATLLRFEISKRGVRFIGEEARHGDTSIAEIISGEMAIPYTNIEMSPEVRGQANIPVGYNEDAVVPDVDRARWNQQREEYMLHAAIAGAEQTESSLVICGRMHAAALADGFRRLGHVVEISDLLDQAWYVEDWFQHMMHDL